MKQVKSYIIYFIVLVLSLFGFNNNFILALESSITDSKKIAVVGSGYVGLANAVLLAQNYNVYILDIIKEKIDMVNNKVSPFVDNEISDYLQNKKLNLTATLDENVAYKDADFVIIATPTDYDIEKNFFNTSSIESVLQNIFKISPDTTVVIKSTIPIGYTKKINEQYPGKKIIFSPEFLREGKALYDTLYPSRIIVGGDLNDKFLLNDMESFASILKQGAKSQDVPVILTGSTEAEAIKLFSNSYLALRVAYFNELDTYCETYGLNTKQIIDGVCADSRIGSHYNNPSFGYGGYCLPKDSKQLLANFKDVPNDIIKAIVDSNETRKNFITEKIIEKNRLLTEISDNKADSNFKTVGIHKLAMKFDSDNFRQSAIIDVIKKLKHHGLNVIIYEPTLKNNSFLDCKVINDFDEFKKLSSVIVTNRFDNSLSDVSEKVYSRDVYCKD